MIYFLLTMAAEWCWAEKACSVREWVTLAPFEEGGDL